MKLLTLDQSSILSGYAIFDDEKLIDYGTFKFDDDLNVRLVKIKNKVQELIQKNGIEKVIIEDIQEQNNLKTYKVLSEVFGVVSESVTESGIPLESMFSSTWKSTLNIKGRAREEQKRNAAAWVKQTYNINPIQDACDAICIGAASLKKQNTDIAFDFTWE